RLALEPHVDDAVDMLTSTGGPGGHGREGARAESRRIGLNLRACGRVSERGDGQSGHQKLLQFHGVSPVMNFRTGPVEHKNRALSRPRSGRSAKVYPARVTRFAANWARMASSAASRHWVWSCALW